MSSHWSIGPRARRLLPWSVAGFALLGFALAYAPPSPAQAKKGDGKTAAKKTKDAKEDKADGEAKEEKKVRPEPKIPPVVDSVVSKTGGVEQVAFINEEITKAWKANKVQPAARCSDYEFIRRATLDIIGRIPTHAELNKFLNDPEKQRRSMLIDRLVDSPECAQNLATIWTILMMTRTGSGEVYREQMHDWLTRKLSGKEQTPDWSAIVTEILTASGSTNKNAAVNFILTHLGEEIKGSPAEVGKYDMVPVTSRTTRLFLGIRTQCVQCHDHPFNGEWGQHHFWGINAFFRQVETNGRPLMMAKKVKGVVGVQQYDLHDNPTYNTKSIVPYERRNAVLLYTDPTFLDGRKIRKDSELTRRQELASFITKSPYFAKAYVNRMWGHFFGKSFTKDAIDDFGESNPVSHPELLDKLAEDWAKKYGHNPKFLIRWICNSQAYGLKTTANKYNDTPEDEVFFARMLLKPMTPEQLFESLMTATESKVKQSKEDHKAKKKAWLDTLVINFGNDEGEEGSFNGTVIQALLLMNGQDINAEIMSKDGAVASAVREYGATHSKVLDYLYKSALCRPPTEKEARDLLNPKMRLLQRVSPAAQNSAAAWEGYYQDVFWALLNSNEFILNH